MEHFDYLSFKYPNSTEALRGKWEEIILCSLLFSVWTGYRSLNVLSSVKPITKKVKQQPNIKLQVNVKHQNPTLVKVK